MSLLCRLFNHLSLNNTIQVCKKLYYVGAGRKILKFLYYYARSLTKLWLQRCLWNFDNVLADVKTLN